MLTFEDIKVFDDLPVVAFIKDESGRYVWANQAWLDIAGVKTLKEVLGKDDSALIWAEQAEALKRADKQVLDEGKTHKIKEHVLTASGKIVTGNSCKFPVMIDGKKYLFGISVIIDE